MQVRLHVVTVSSVNHQLMSNSNRDNNNTNKMLEEPEQEQHKDKCRFTKTWLQAQSIIEILGCASVCALKACKLLLQVTVVISKVTNESLPVRWLWRDTLFWVHVLWNCVTLAWSFAVRRLMTYFLLLGALAAEFFKVITQVFGDSFASLMVESLHQLKNSFTSIKLSFFEWCFKVNNHVI